MSTKVKKFSQSAFVKLNITEKWAEMLCPFLVLVSKKSQSGLFDLENLKYWEASLLVSVIDSEINGCWKRSVPYKQQYKQ